MILSGTAHLVTIPASNHAAAFGRANPEKYLVRCDGGLYIGFADDFLRDDSVNADEALARPALLPPGTPRPVSIPFWGWIPVDFLGRRGCRRGRDRLRPASRSARCRPAPGRRTRASATLELASCTAMLAKVWWGDVSADRLLTGLPRQRQRRRGRVAYER